MFECSQVSLDYNFLVRRIIIRLLVIFFAMIRASRTTGKNLWTIKRSNAQTIKQSNIQTLKPVL